MLWQTGTKEETTVVSDHLPPANTSSLQKMKCEGTKGVKPTEPRLRLVLMLCFPLSPSSSSLTGLNIKGGGSTGFSMGGSSPYFLKWMRQSVHSKMFSRPPWCQSLEAWGRKSDSLEMKTTRYSAQANDIIWRKKREKKKGTQQLEKYLLFYRQLSPGKLCLVAGLVCLPAHISFSAQFKNCSLKQLYLWK